MHCTKKNILANGCTKDLAKCLVRVRDAIVDTVRKCSALISCSMICCCCCKSGHVHAL